MAKNRRSISLAGRSELAARAAAFEWMTKSLDKLEPTGDPSMMLAIATAFSKMTTAQMKVRQVKGKEEDDDDEKTKEDGMNLTDLKSVITEGIGGDK